MIVTTQAQLGRYCGLSAFMDSAISYIQSIDMQNLQLGKEPIVGDDVYMWVKTYLTKERADGKFETHDKYIDIQILIEGEEIVYCADRDSMQASTEYIVESDKTNYNENSDATPVLLSPGRVLIFFPEDAHKACIKVHDTVIPVRKLLLKVRV